MIYEVESEVKTTRVITSPSNKDMDEVEDNKTPVPRGSRALKEFDELSDDGEPIYITPFLLEKKIQRMGAPPPENTEADSEDSEIEIQLRGKVNKKGGAVKSASNKVS